MVDCIRTETVQRDTCPQPSQNRSQASHISGENCKCAVRVSKFSSKQVQCKCSRYKYMSSLFLPVDTEYLYDHHYNANSAFHPSGVSK